MKKFNLNSKNLIIVLGAIVFLLALQMLLKSSKGSERFYKAERKDFGVIFGYGKVKSLDEQLVTTNTKGRIEEVFVTEGDTVEKGEILFKVTPEQYEKKHLIKKSERMLLELALREQKLDNKLLLLEMDSKINNLNLEKSLAEKYISTRERLAKKGIISAFEFDKIKQELVLLKSKHSQEVQKKRIMSEIFEEKIKAFEERLEVFDKQYELEFHGQYEIQSGIDGVVQDIYIRTGQFVDVGKGILSIIGKSDVKVVLDVPQNKASKIKLNDSAEILNGDSIIKARVYNISTKVESGTVSITLDAVEDNNLKKFINHSVSGRIYTESIKRLLVVKHADIFQASSSGNYSVLNKVGDVEERVIQFGESNEGYIEVRSGLLPGEQIKISN